MNTAKRLALIAAGYAFAIGAGFAAVAVNELFMPTAIAQTSPGMVAFGDVILFLAVAGFLGLAPTWFLLRLALEKAPRAVVTVELLVAALGPLSWLAVIHLAGGPSSRTLPAAVGELLGPLVAFGAIPRIVLGPVVLVVEGVTFLLLRGRVTRMLLAVAMLMDFVPLGLFALHMMRATRY